MLWPFPGFPLAFAHQVLSFAIKKRDKNSSVNLLLPPSRQDPCGSSLLASQLGSSHWYQCGSSRTHLCHFPGCRHRLPFLSGSFASGGTSPESLRLPGTSVSVCPLAALASEAGAPCLLCCSLNSSWWTLPFPPPRSISSSSALAAAFALWFIPHLRSVLMNTQLGMLSLPLLKKEF